MRLTRRAAIRTTLAGVLSGAHLARSATASGATHLIWRKPGDAGEALRYGASGRGVQPQPPFRFEEEDLGGSNPKIKVRDRRGVLWIVKWGKEVHAEAFASRLAAAAGYFVRTTLYAPEGRIEGVRNLGRAADCVDSSGRFESAALKLIALDQPYLSGHNWSWTNNPFLETEVDLKRLNGLKILMMLTSNWDNKDASEPERGVNTAIYEDKKSAKPRYLYAFDDWGATMGRWGGIADRSKWDAQGYAEQTPELVKGIGPDGFMMWGFDGKSASDLKTGIRPGDVGALLESLARLRSQDVSAGLQACGAAAEDNRLFTDSLLSRLEQLRRVATSTT